MTTKRSRESSPLDEVIRPFFNLLPGICPKRSKSTQSYGIFGRVTVWACRLFGIQTQEEESQEATFDKLSDSIRSLREHCSNLEEREDQLRHRIKTEVEKAKEAIKQNKREKAKTHLRRQKNLESQIELTQRQKMKLEATVLEMEAYPLNMDSAAVLVNATAVLKTAASQIGDVESIAEGLESQIADLNSISNALGRSCFIDHDVSAELAALEEQTVDEMLSEIGSIPTGAPKKQKAKQPGTRTTVPIVVDDQDCLDQLENELNLISTAGHRKT